MFSLSDTTSVRTATPAQTTSNCSGPSSTNTDLPPCPSTHSQAAIKESAERLNPRLQQSSSHLSEEEAFDQYTQSRRMKLFKICMDDVVEVDFSEYAKQQEQQDGHQSLSPTYPKASQGAEAIEGSDDEDQMEATMMGSNANIGDAAWQEDKIAKEYGKQCATILSYAGLSGKSMRSTSDWNQYQAWHASKYPKSEDADMIDYGRKMKTQFELHRDKEQYPDIWEEVHAHDVLRIADTRDLSPQQIHNLVIKVWDEFSKSCKLWENTQNILIVGVVLYTGGDEAGHHASGVFSGSNMLVQLAKETKYDILQFIDYLTSGEGEASNVPLPDLSARHTHGGYPCCGEREAPQDRNHRMLPLIMVEKYVAIGIPSNKKVNFSWAQALDIMWQYQMQIIDWLAKVVPIGPGFSMNGPNGQ
ncbi:hypothetical protein BS17DRAFT_818799 [Gyrodon lividus]|nr:hypothetical protein BS17DRAFT_818799 [Gyrodon lividus]